MTFRPLIAALSKGRVSLKTLNLSFNQFFKDPSMSELLDYMETKAIDHLDCDCKSQQPILASLK